MIGRSSQYTMDHAKKRENSQKNRYINILPCTFYFHLFFFFSQIIVFSSRTIIFLKKCIKIFLTSRCNEGCFKTCS